jgi:hypothetical protein
MRIDIHHHFEHGSVGPDEAKEILTHLRALRAQGADVMAKVDELLQELVEANTVTNEIARDLDALIARLNTPGLSEAEADEVKAKITALKDRLTGVAAKYTSETTVDE